MKEKSTYNEGFDLLKGLLAVMVVAIHTVMLTKIHLISFISIPLVRTAVPIFFLLSSYFFFKRINSLPSSQHLGLLKKSVVRYLQLYGIWFVVTAPATFKATDYFSDGLAIGIKQLIINFIFGSTFFASWYIMALILGIPIIYFLSRSLNNRILLLIGFVFNAFAVLLTNYGLSPIGQTLLNWLHSWPIGMSPSLNFMVGLVWIVLGKMFADGDLNRLINKKSMYWTAFFLVLLYGEEFLTQWAHIVYYNDDYFMLLPVCTFFFGWLLTTNVKVPGHRFFRAFSTIAYCFHGSFAQGVSYLLSDRLNIQITRFSQSLLMWAFVVSVCSILTIMILRLEKVKGFGWLRLSH